MTMLGLMLATGMLTKVFVGILISVHFLLCLFLIAVVLLQSGKAGDLSSAFGGGATQANVAAMSSENILTRATKISAFGFMLTSLLLALFAHGDSGSDSVIDALADEAPIAGAVDPAAAVTPDPAAVTPDEPTAATPEPAATMPGEAAPAADEPADDAAGDDGTPADE